MRKSIIKNSDGFSARTYNKDFFQKLNIDRGATGGARQIVPIVLSLLGVNGINNPSVVDVGCGTGIWLNEFKRYNCRVHGFDGSSYSTQCMINKDEFETVDFVQKNTATKKYDLALSLEVAEHIPENHCENYMRFLTSLSDIILFSAAIPYQGGQGHVNEQWHTYWVKKFKKYGYECVDIIRDRIWNDPDIWFYYKQNMLLFMKTGVDYDTFIGDHQRPVLNRVHPDLWRKVNHWIPTRIVLAAYNNSAIYNIYQKIKNFKLLLLKRGR